MTVILLWHIDIDECFEKMDDCHQESNATCENTDGSFDCSCREGFEGNGTVCDGTHVITNRITCYN